MNVKRGSVVSHAIAKEWGTGKVVEVNDVRATIRFSDGMVRKIIASHFSDLHPADPASYQAPAKKGTAAAQKPRSSVRIPKGKKKAKPAPQTPTATGVGVGEVATL